MILNLETGEKKEISQKSFDSLVDLAVERGLEVSRLRAELGLVQECGKAAIGHLRADLVDARKDLEFYKELSLKW